MMRDLIKIKVDIRHTNVQHYKIQQTDIPQDTSGRVDSLLEDIRYIGNDVP